MRKSLVLLVALVAILSTGCIQADLKLDVNDDGSGTYSAVIAVNEDLLKSLGGLAALDPDAEPASGSTGDICKDMVKDAEADTPKGGKVEPYKKGDFCGVKLSASFANIEEGLELLSSSDSGGASLEDVTLEKQGNGWVFDAKWNPDDTSAATGGADDEMSKQFLQGFQFVIRIKLPGGQVDQNADLIEGDGTMVWNLDPTASRTLEARTEAGAAVIKSKVQTDAGKTVSASAASASGASAGGDDGGSKTWLYVVIGLVVVAIIAGIVLMKRNKTKAVPAMAGMAGMPSSMPSGAMGGPPIASPSSAPMTAAPSAPAVAAAAAQSAGEPQWDAARNAYIQWDPVNNRWMQYDQAAATWKPIE